MSTAVDWKYKTNIASDPDNCILLIELLLKKLDEFGWQNRDTFGIHMAMEEAIMNAIHHGNRCCPSKDVEVTMRIAGDFFYSRITDQGTGFDPDNLPDPTDEENLEKTSGRGVMLMRSFMDEVNYNVLANSVEIKKFKTE